VPAGPINTVDGGVAFAEQVGLDPIVEVGEDRLPMVRNPITLSATPASYDLAPPRIDEHGAEIRRWLAEEDG
jgi:crotonobetainyl-CoA:carnitine CoA-transferase CaiB-like acyl-CoA transferase